MAESTKIEWTDHTVNFWQGCRKVHAGCENCYAEHNISCKMQGVAWGTKNQGGVRKVTAASTWNAPWAWNARARDKGERQRVFAMSLGDVFESWSGPVVDHRGDILWRLNDKSISAKSRRGDGYLPQRQLLERFPDEASARKNGWKPAPLYEVRQDAWGIIEACASLEWQILTKHGLWNSSNDVTQRWPHHCTACDRKQWWSESGKCLDASCRGRVRPTRLAHVSLIGSAADQRTADRILKNLQRIKELNICGHVGISAEPLVGSLRLTKDHRWIDWFILGGESKQKGNCRRLDIQWMRDLLEDCRSLEIPVFVKQLGSQVGTSSGNGDWLQHEVEDKKGGDPREWPADLRVREFPKSVAD